MQGWTNDDRMMIACCNDGTRPVIFKIERIDIPETIGGTSYVPPIPIEVDVKEQIII